MSLMIDNLANVGLPMIFWQMPVAAIALLPVVVLESLIAVLILKQPFRPVLLRVFAANALSTFVGIPIAWVVMFIFNILLNTIDPRRHGYDTPWDAFESLIRQAAWLFPSDGHMFWLIPAATLVLLLPYFLVSIFIERWLLRRTFPDIEPYRLNLAAWLTNAASYGGLAALTAYWLYDAIYS